jgi:putative oxidoreductase
VLSRQAENERSLNEEDRPARVGVKQGDKVMNKWIFGTPVSGFIPSVGLLLFRVVFGGFMLFGHGWSKLMSFSESAAKFPDPLGIGNEASMVCAILCEVACSALVMLGLATRIAVLPLVFTMAVAALMIHGGDPLFMGEGAAKEPALIYLTSFALLFFTGAGVLSLDAVFGKK